MSSTCHVAVAVKVHDHVADHVNVNAARVGSVGGLRQLVVFGVGFGLWAVGLGLSFVL